MSLKRARSATRPVAKAKVEDESIKAFEELLLPQQLLQNIQSADIKKPNDIQQTLVPLLLSNPNRNIYIKSRPHSGKKTAFLIYTIQRIDPNLQATQAIILAPTCELVYYIAERAEQLAAQMNIRVYKATDQDAKPLQKTNAHLVVTTVGTALFLLGERLIDPNAWRFIVFDELDLLTNSEKKLHNLLTLMETSVKRIQPVPQALFFSTTFCSKSLYHMKNLGFRGLLIRQFLRELPPVFEQFKCFPSNAIQKEKQLLKVLQNVVLNRVVVYSQNFQKAKRLAELLEDHYNVILVTRLNTVRERMEAFQRFNQPIKSDQPSKSKKLSKSDQPNKSKPTILCTHYPIGHGIRLNGVFVVINFELPVDNDVMPIEYWHRIAKCTTSRSEERAIIVNLVDEDSIPQLNRLEKYFKRENFKISMMKLKLD